MLGRTPEFLGKKIEVHEVKLAATAFLLHPLMILSPMAATFALQLDLGQITNPSSHGLSEVLYAFTSMSANNGSAMAGLASNTNWYNLMGAVVIGVGRYAPIVLMLALAGSLAAKQSVPVSAGTMNTEGKLFAGVLMGTIIIVGALVFFPVLAIGAIAEHFAMLQGVTY